MFPKEGTYIKRYIDNKNSYVIFKIDEYVGTTKNNYRFCFGKIVFESKDMQTYEIDQKTFIVYSTRYWANIEEGTPDEYLDSGECFAELI